LKRRNVLAATILALTVTATGCTKTTTPQDTPTKPATTASATPTPPAKPPTYVMPGNVCAAVSGDAFTDLVPAAPPKADESNRVQSATVTSSTCVLRLGTLDNSVMVSVGVDLFTRPTGAQAQFEGFREVMFKDQPGARNVGGVGSGAYFFSNTLGPHLVVYHGNAHIGVALMHITASKTTPPADIETRLVTTAKHVLATLPTT
jgi:hypothetical protein